MRRELVFQDHIIDSYVLHGGKASKWASAMQIGKPDLVCSLKGHEMHLMEVKHAPNFGPVQLGFRKVMLNPMTARQRREARDWWAGGGVVLLGVVGASSEAHGSWLGLIDARVDELDCERMPWVPYVRGSKYAVKALLVSLMTNFMNDGRMR